MRRREFAGMLASAAVAAAQAPTAAPVIHRNGRIKQSVTRGVFGMGIMSLEDQCRIAAGLGVQGFDLIGSQDWPTLKKYGLRPAMTAPTGITVPNGINAIENHDQIEKATRPLIDECAAAGCPNLIVLSGNKRRLTDEQGISACVSFLNRVKAQAEDKGVTIALELLNSKIDHPDYQCNHTAWGVEVCKRVNSPRVKLLFDIYHMQVMEGDIYRTIRENIQWIAHFHTAGVPGRHEIDGSQELDYRFVAKTLVDLGFAGYVAHEYRPLRDPLESLKQALEIMDV